MEGGKLNAQNRAEEAFLSAVEQGYGLDGCPDEFTEFRDILLPAGFYVYSVKGVESGKREMYYLTVGRKVPKRCNEGSSSEAAHPVCQGESRCTADSPSQCNHGS